MTNIVTDETMENLSDLSTEKYIKLSKQSHNNLKVYQMGEPILLYPNSSNNLADILDTLKKNLDISAIREWTYIGCDGPPCFLASR